MKKEIIGLSSSHIQRVNFGNDFDLHKAVMEPFSELYHLGLKEGFDMKVVSGFRSFERQLNIWNSKFFGSRKLLDLTETEIVIDNLTDEEICRLILIWSALPGTSRHHWGTDLDVVDLNAIRIHEYEPKLLVSEFNPGGIFHEFSVWLKESLAKFSFFMPYSTIHGGVAAEPWHISYGPIAQKYVEAFDVTYLKRTLLNSNIMGKEWVLHNLEWILKNFVQNVPFFPIKIETSVNKHP